MPFPIRFVVCTYKWVSLLEYKRLASESDHSLAFIDLPDRLFRETAAAIIQLVDEHNVSGGG